MPKQGTLISGIGACQAIDSSGESIIIANLDCSSLDKKQGIFTYEHSKADPSKILGKITAYKKIYSLKDCETPDHEKFWLMCQMPFLYVFGELFDAEDHLQAKEVAAVFRYDAKQKAQGTKIPATMWFSVEGSILDKQPEDGIKVIKDSICRIVTITTAPCSQLCAAELYIPQAEIVEQNPMAAFEKSEPLPYIALTKSMKPILEYLPAGNYFDFTPSDHSDAADAHFILASQAKGTEFAYHMAKSEEHMGKAMLPQESFTFTHKPEMSASDGTQHYGVSQGNISHGYMTHNPKSTIGAKFNQTKSSIAKPNNVHAAFNSQLPKLPALGKALAAGMGSGAPSTLTGGAALSREHMRKKVEKVASKVKNLEKMGEYISKKYKLNKHEGIALAKILVFRKMKS